MKVKKITEGSIIFDNNNKITFDHQQDCCEYNYANFRDIEDEIKDVEFDSNLQFEKVEHGFRFGSKNTHMYFVPCYSDQNGYYSNSVDIYYNRKKVIDSVDAKIQYDY